MIFQNRKSNNEFAVRLEWEAPWDSGAPIPHVISSGLDTYLIYYLREIDDKWDGTYAKVIDPTSNEDLPIAVVNFKNSYSYKFGGANDEVIHGHYLWGKGLASYSAHIIMNSNWIREEEKINSIHDYYKPERWKERKHYFLLFHDELFECIADGYEIKTYSEPFKSVLLKVLNDLD